jgi:L-amino acid N-acyltransferase YncA
MITGHTYKLSAYPKDILLGNGVMAVLRPMTRDDAAALLDFFLNTPEEDRYYLKDDVTSPVVIQQWIEELDYDRALPLLAWVDNKIVADGTLHRTRTLARRHVGEVRILVTPAYRNYGLGTTLMRELAAIANENGLERLKFEAVADKEDEAIRAAEHVGFVKVAALPGHGKGPDGHPRDIVLMEMMLGRWFDWWLF